MLFKGPGQKIEASQKRPKSDGESITMFPILLSWPMHDHGSALSTCKPTNLLVLEVIARLLLGKAAYLENETKAPMIQYYHSGDGRTCSGMA